MDELNDKIEKLEQENNQLIKKVDEYKQRYLEAQKSNKVVTSRIDTGLHPSAGPRRTTSGGSLRRPGLRVAPPAIFGIAIYGSWAEQ